MEDKKVEKSCMTCEFNFGDVCAGYGTRTDTGKETYGMPMEDVEKMFPTGCDDYGISLEAFIEQEKRMDDKSEVGGYTHENCNH